jgi:putative FmdB family regulatory protein
MPIYEFECKKCKARSEVLQRLNDKLPVKCRKCGGRLEKLISASAIKFKGTGWYVTDYAGNGKKGKSSEEKSESSSSSSSSDKSESKSGSKEASPAKKTSETTSSTKAPSGD